MHHPEARKVLAALTAALNSPADLAEILEDAGITLEHPSTILPSPDCTRGVAVAAEDAEIDGTCYAVVCASIGREETEMSPEFALALAGILILAAIEVDAMNEDGN